MVRHLRRDIDRARHSVQCIEILREGFPVPFQSFGERDAGDFLHRLHQADQRGMMLAPHRREADAAIAEQHRGDAMPRRRREFLVPRRLAVIMRVHIDPAGRHQHAVGLDLAPAGPGLTADFGDAVAIDRDVAGEGRLAGAIDDGAAADDRIVHEGTLLGPCCSQERPAMRVGQGTLRTSPIEMIVPCGFKESENNTDYTDLGTRITRKVAYRT